MKERNAWGFAFATSPCNFQVFSICLSRAAKDQQIFRLLDQIKPIELLVPVN